MKTNSFLSNAIEGYVKYRKASGRNSHSYVKNVILFDHFAQGNIRDKLSLPKKSWTDGAGNVRLNAQTPACHVSILSWTSSST